MTQRAPGSNARLIMFLLDSSGYAAGMSGTAIAAGDTSNAWSLDIANNIDIQTREIGRREHVGAGGKILANVPTGDNSTSQINITVDILDDTLFAALQGTTLDSSTNSEFTIGTPYTTAITVPSIGIIVTEPAPLRVGGTMSYRNRAWSTGQAVIQHGAIAADPNSPTQATIQFVPSLSSTWFTGESVADVSIGAPNDETDCIEFFTDYPIHVVTFISNASDVAVVSTYAPISTTVTVTATPNWLFINGAPTALSSVTIATNTFTLAAAGTSGDRHVIMHKVNHNYST